MAGLLSALNSARTSLEVNQKSIEIVGNNISNINTEGYSRQTAELSPYPSMNFGNFFVGQGVKIDDVQREHDVFITAQLNTKSADFGYQNGQTRSLSELERVFNVTDENIATEVDRYFDSWQELSAAPADLVLRDSVIQRGELLAVNFHNTVTELDEITANINEEIISNVDDINAKITEVADLNERIFNIEIHGQTANSARDRRETLAQELATTIGAEVYEDSKGMLSVQLPGGLPLVQGNSAMSISSVSTGSNVELHLEAGGVTRQLSDINVGGEIAGLYHIRNSFIPELKNDLDYLAYNIATTVNTEHNNGSGLDGSVGNFWEVPPNFGALPPGPPNAWDGAARSLAVEVTDAASIAAGATPATAGDPAAPGDNSNALILSSLGEQHLVDGIDTFNSFYGKMTSSVGLESNHNLLSLKGAEDAVVQLTNVRDGMVGVSLEEEMISLIQFQRGFESSAKFLSTVDEMMITLVNI